MTKGQRLKPEQIVTLLRQLELKLPTLHRVALGRMAFVKALMAPSETTYSMEKSSTV